VTKMATIKVPGLKVTQGVLRPPPAPGDPFGLEGAGFQAVVKTPRPAESGGEPTESK
jgi:hypothetical protein